MVDHRIVRKQRVTVRAWERSPNVLRLQSSCGEATKARECISMPGLFAGAFGTADKLIVLVLRIGYGTNRAKRLWLSSGGMENVVVSTAIGRNLKGDTPSSSTSATHHDMIGVSSKFADVLLYPSQDLSLVQQSIV